MIEYVKRHHTTLDDPLNKGISVDAAIRDGILLSPDALGYQAGAGVILTYGGQPET